VKAQEELAAFLLTWLQQVPLAKGSADRTRETTALLLSWTIFGAGVEWSSGDHQCSVEEWARVVVDILVEGAARVVTIPAEEPRSQKGKGTDVA
jgi:hypothetical protein